MTTDTGPETATAIVLKCPQCGKRGKTVRPETLRALLKQEYAPKVSVSEESNWEAGCKPSKGKTDWRFCDSKNCNVVYFSEEDDTTFTKSQLKVAVGVKETAGERPLCYCFGHSVASIQEELRSKGRSDALDDVRAKMKDPGCRCETENPSGSCCLGNVTKGIKIAEEELGMNVSEVQTQTDPAESLASRGETIAKAGTILSAIMASSCCWLPLLLLVVGVSGAGVASALEAYRPIFIVVTFGFLGAAFYFTYRPKKATSGGVHGCCATDAEQSEAHCARTSKGRFNMMTLNKSMLWVVMVLAIVFLLFPHYVGTLLGNAPATSVTVDLNRAVVRIEGMTCPGCATVAEQAIRKVPGVLAVDVDYGRGEAIVGAESCCPFPKANILKVIEDVGFTGSILEAQ